MILRQMLLRKTYTNNPIQIPIWQLLQGFLIENKDHPYSKGVIDKGFQQFINNYIMQFELATKVPINFVGSIAHFLKDELTAVLERNDLIVGVIRQRPIEGLVEFHLENL